MPTVFIAGSIKIKKLHPYFVDRIVNIVDEKLDVIVGDANGADRSIQIELSRQMAENVTVYYTNLKPRNNIGNWKANRVLSSAKPGTREFFSAKDLVMADVANFGLMIWDTTSTGTLNNVFELLRGGKKCVIFVNKNRKFIDVKEPSDILKLIAVMSDGAQARAEQKMGLRSKIFHLTHEQLGLSL